MRLTGLLSVLLVGSAFAATPKYAATFNTGAVKVSSISSLTFGPDGLLFLGDSMGGAIHALDLGDRTPGDAKEVSIGEVESKIAALLGTDRDDVLIHDMAVNPISRNIYLSVSRSRGNWNSIWQLPNDLGNADVLLKVTPAGEFSEVDLTSISHSTAELPNPIAKEKMNEWKKTSMRVDAITDLAYSDGKLYVAGLSNEEFSSAMRVMDFPFSGKASSTSLEVFHGAHGKFETHAPIRSFLPYKVHGKPHILAAYLCTPLALFPTEGLADKQHIKGRTLAELGNGNYPLDMVPYRKNGKDYVFILNSMRAPMSVAAADLEASKDDITVKASPGEGLPFRHLRGQGISQADAFGDDSLLMMMRGPHGRLEMVTFSSRWL